MKNETNETLLKKRSYRACIADAFSMFKAEWLTLTKQYWKQIAGVAVVAGALGAWQQTLMAGATFVGYEFHEGQFTVCFLLHILLLLTTVGATFHVANKRGLVWNIKRYACLLPILLSILAVFLALAGLTAMAYIMSSKHPEEILVAKAVGVMMIFLPFYLVVSIPQQYFVTRYMMEPESDIKETFGASFMAGFRCWGFLFVTMFLASLCVSLAGVILSMPSIFLNFISCIGYYSAVVNGDPVSTVSGKWALDFASSAWSTIVGINIYAYSAYVLRNIWGTMACKAREREEQMQENSQEDVMP